jgi:uncharacterized membrane protein YeaQ/YmgE (transglycosylase-associated protein family)
MGIIWFLIIGIVAGWLAGKIMKGGGFGLIGDLVVGVIGGLLGGFLFGQLGEGLIGSLITATVGDHPPLSSATDQTGLRGA